VYLDKYEGISIDECAEISRHLNANLDRDTEDYELEVSSPGLSAPFKVKEQYEKYKGRNVEVLLNNGKKLTGKLMAFSDTGIELEVFIRETGNKKGKKNIPQLVKMDLQEIKSTKSVVSFKQ
jgi:ribosome maturation factor RimP